MLPLNARQKQYHRTLLESDTMARAHRFFARHSKNRTSIITSVVLAFFVLYLLWPRSMRSSFDFLHPISNKRPSYENWPRKERAEAVKEAFLHAYGSYERYAAPADELRPLRNSSQQNFNGWGVSMYDALDTLLLMDLKPEFERAVKHVSGVTFPRHPKYDVMFFETVIRYLGGLLSAYALSGNRILLLKAEELGNKLLPVFNTPTGLAAFSINTDTGEPNLGPRHGAAVLAEFASCQMEYKFLSHLTGNGHYFTLVDKSNDWLQRGQLENGMWHTTWNISNGKQIDNHITIGALADSGYEYLLKQYIMSGKSEKHLRDLYLTSASSIIRNMLYLSKNRQILYVTDIYTGAATPIPSRKFEHLSCFLPGLLALGAHALEGEMDPTERELHMWAAEGLAYSCWLMYADQPSGLAPEEAVFEHFAPGYTGDRKGKIVDPRPHGRPYPPMANPAPDVLPPKTEGDVDLASVERDQTWMDAVGQWRAKGGKGKPPGVPGTEAGVAKPMPKAKMEEKDYLPINTKYLLRPETIESLYVMWRTTKDEVWRDRAWEIFLAIEENCRMELGYASVLGVNRAPPDLLLPLDEMPSYALAETWKYLYLIFLDHDPIPMDKYVLNTEAHPFPIFEWSESQKKALGVH